MSVSCDERVHKHPIFERIVWSLRKLENREFTPETEYKITQIRIQKQNKKTSKISNIYKIIEKETRRE